MYNLAYPIIYSGQVIGYTWTTAKIEEFESEFQAAITVIVIAGISLWGDRSVHRRLGPKKIRKWVKAACP